MPAKTKVTTPTETLQEQIARLPHLTATQLRAEYLRVFGEPTRSANKSWMAKRIAWRWQRDAYGGLSPALLAQALELAKHAELRLNPPPGLDLFAADPAPAPVTPTLVTPPAIPRDRRLPAPGTQLSRVYKGRTLTVEVRRDGFAYLGQHYTSLSAVAKAITGQQINGYLFFQLTAQP
jgi:hypothetical protein